jgi:hypothetical protein
MAVIQTGLVSLLVLLIQPMKLNASVRVRLTVRELLARLDKDVLIKIVLMFACLGKMLQNVSVRIRILAVIRDWFVLLLRSVCKENVLTFVLLGNRWLVQPATVLG